MDHPPVPEIQADMQAAGGLEAVEQQVAGLGAELPRAAALARISATDAFVRAAEESMQVHGGIGYTWEGNCHFFYRRARLLAISLGDTSDWAERLVATI